MIEKNTTFKYIIDSKNPSYVFYNSKENAKQAERYFPDDLDKYENGKLKGSIAGYRFSVVTDDKHYIDIVLFITTYGKKFVDTEAKNEDKNIYIKNTKANIEEFIFKKYARRIKIELSSWYLNNYNDLHHENLKKDS